MAQVELLNSYKDAFVKKRYLQTIVGGLNLRVGDDAPLYAYLVQVVVYLTPWVLGGCLTLLYEYHAFGTATPDYVYGIVSGILVSLFVLAIQLTSASLQRRTSEVTRLTHAGGQKNILSEEDEVNFDSCLSPHVIQYLVPVKKHRLNVWIHAAVSCLLCGYGLLYLAPTTLNLLFSSTGVTVVWYVLSWLVLCNAQYSLTVKAPPELATFRTTDIFELASLSRPFYVLAFLFVDLLWRYCPSLVGSLTLPNQVLHIAFISLPVLWSLGVLPPLEALILWLLEQILVHVLGGSPMATNLRLVTMSCLSGLAVLIASLLPTTLPIILFCALAGYLLSLDLCGMFNFILGRLASGRTSSNKTRPDRPAVPTSNDDETVIVKPDRRWAFVVLHHVLLVMVTTGVAVGMYFYAPSATVGAWQALGITIIVSAKLEMWLRQFQQVYIFGVFRNCLYPRDVYSIGKFMARKRRLRWIARCHRVLFNFVIPVVMVAYVTLGTTVTALSMTSPPSFLLGIASVRAFRWIWQSTHNSLLEISVVHFINFFAGPSPASAWAAMGLGPQLMIVGVARDRLSQVLHKLYVYLTILVTSYTVKKQRRPSSIPLLVASAFLFPLTLLVIVVAAALSAPLLPLFTLPVLLIGFPRPARFWPGTVGSSASTCADTVYYKEMMPQLVAAFQNALSSGSLGFPQPGYHYLLRFQDRMAWVHVLECGFGYYTLSVKGMELQETSCHTTEALELEAQFHEAFEVVPSGCSSLNPYLAHTMTPMDVLTFRTYSDARSTLTGLIDSPSMLEAIDAAFCKALVWVLVKHTLGSKDSRPPKSIPESSPRKGLDMTTIPVIGEMEPSISPQGMTNVDKMEDQATCPSSKDSGHPESLLSRPHSVISFEMKRSHSWSSLGSFGDDGMELDPVRQQKQRAGSLSAAEEDNVFENIPGSVRAGDEEDDLLKELQFGLPVADTGTPKHQQHRGIKLASSIQFSSAHSSKLSLPFKWREIPIQPSEVTPLLGRFPSSWFKSVLLHLGAQQAEGTISEEAVNEMMGDAALVGMYSYLTMACYLVACGGNLLEGGQAGTTHVYRTYCGDLPWSPHLEWLSEDKELFSIVTQAFRLAFKLAYDQLILGEEEEDEDLVTNLEDYETNWYLGSDTDDAWKTAVEERKPQLFSLMFNALENTYHARVLSHQPVMSHVGRLNQEMVRALWASLSMELLYMTNDDEERYSIQAHPVILRNLTIQSADPPLGYPIYASAPISVPVL